MPEAASDAWFPYPHEGPSRRWRLFVFPCAGGGAAAWRRLRPHVPAHVECWPLQLPGHETRLREAPLASMDALAAAALPALRPRLRAPFAFLGHSLGARLAFEVARRLAAGDGPLPGHLFAAGAGAPHLPVADPLHALPDGAFLAALARMGGTPPAVLADAALMALFLPVLRADLAASERWTADDPLPVPITVLCGRDDREIDPVRLRAWGRQTTLGFRQVELPGGHFFPFSAAAETFAEIARSLAAEDGRPPPRTE